MESDALPKRDANETSMSTPRKTVSSFEDTEQRSVCLDSRDIRACGMSRWKKVVGLILLNACILGALLLMAELCYRSLLFSNVSWIEPFRRPELYADWYSDGDAWKLHYLFGHWSGPAKPDPLLGWIKPDILPGSYRHKAMDALGSRAPVLLYGDSFAEGLSPSQFFSPSHRLSTRYCLINYGVYGYGLDQIYLLYTRTINILKNPMVVIGLLDTDLDRSVLNVRDGQKPYFRVEGETLQLCGVPIDSDPHRFFATHPPKIYSYLFRGAARSLMSSLRHGSLETAADQDAEVRRKKAVNGAILAAMIADLKKRKIRYVFLIFESPVQFFEPLDWRAQFIVRALRQHGAKYILAREVIERQLLRDTYCPQVVMNSPRDFHPNARYYELVVQALHEWMHNNVCGGPPQELAHESRPYPIIRSNDGQ
jgi:hypothetical protein